MCFCLCMMLYNGRGWNIVVLGSGMLLIKTCTRFAFILLVQDLTTDICTDEDRLMKYGFIVCEPYLQEMATLGTEMACM